MINKGIYNLFYSRLNKYPSNKETLEKIKRLLPSKSILETPTCYGSVSLQARLNSIIKNFLRNQSLIKEASKYYEGNNNLFVHLAPACRVIYPKNLIAYVPNHIDIAYNRHITSSKSKYPPFITFWIPLQGTPHIHGGLKLYGNKFFDSKKASNHKIGLWIEENFDTTAEEYIPEYEIGDCISFYPHTLHGSTSNKAKLHSKKPASGDFRISMDVRIFPHTSRTTKHYMSLLTGQCFEPGQGPCTE